MIVISGALVVVAIVLLAIGLISGTLGFIYASIAGSVVAFIFLIVGVMQRRGEDIPAAASGAPALASSTDLEGVTAIIPATSRSLPGDGDARGLGAAAVSGTVLVVEGRPRYHVAGCRYLTGKAAAEVAVDKARRDGFTACGVCKPDEALAAAPVATAAPAQVAESVAAESVVAESVAAARNTTRKAPARVAAKAPAVKKAAAKAPAKTAPKAAPVKPVTKAPARKATPAKLPAKTPAKTATKAPAKAAAKKTPAKKTPAKKATTRR